MAKTPAKKRKEASATDKRNYAKQFEQAKQDKYNSWVGHDVFGLVDIRKLSKWKRRNYVSSRWVLTVERGRDGNFLKCKARWVLEVSRTDRRANCKKTALLLLSQISGWLARQQLITIGI